MITNLNQQLGDLVVHPVDEQLDASEHLRPALLQRQVGGRGLPALRRRRTPRHLARHRRDEGRGPEQGRLTDLSKL